MTILLRLVLVTALSAIAQVATAADNLRQDLEDLMTLLPGEYDSERHMREDVMAGVPKAKRHGWVNRSFVAVEAPDVADNVVVQTVVYNGRDGLFDDSEFLVWTVAVDEARGGIAMQPYWFKQPEGYVAISRNADGLAGITPDDLKPAGGVAGCELFWIRKDDVFSARTNVDTCVAPFRDVVYSWLWEYTLSASVLTVTYKGFTQDGRFASGRDDAKPWRLDRLF